MTIRSDYPTPSRTGLWFSILSGPVVWFVHFAFIYSVVDFGCVTNMLDYTLLGAPAIHAIILISTVIAALFPIAGALLAWRSYRTHQADVPNEEVGKRIEFMMLLGMAFSLTFLFVIVIEVLPVFVLSTCEGVAG